jgi:quinoprotein glucose dehydrogenase
MNKQEPNRRRWLPWAGILLGAGLAACGEAPAPAAPQAQTDTAANSSTSSDANIAAPNYETWDQYLGGADSSQFSSLQQISRANVGQLSVAWTYPTGERGAYRFNPLVVDGVMYVLAHDNALIALNAATGEEIWRHDNEGRVSSRGINYWHSEDGSDRRLLYLNNGFLTALNADTGATVTTFGDAGRVDLRVGLDGDISAVRQLQTDNPGRIFEDLIIMSLPAGSGGYASTPADIHAYNIRTGALAWIFHTVPRPGEFGADTWPEGSEAYGGVHNWSESTVDAERGIVFIPTGTARYDFYGGNRHGANLFGNSLLALNARTGERLWHFQTIHHDLWDLDLPTAPKLLTVRHNGEQIDAVAQPSKQGLLFVFNRETGEPLWPIEERPVPQSDAPGEQSWPTQPFPTQVPPFARQRFTVDDINPYISESEQAAIREQLTTYRNEGPYTPPSLQGTIMLPGHNGGANWGSSAVDPINGKLYVVSKELPTTANLRVPDSVPEGLDVPGAGPDFTPYTAPVDFMLQSNGLSAIGPPWSQITAYDLNTGTIEWQVPNGEIMTLAAQGITGTGSQAPRGGPVVTAGGLIFVATSSDRKFRARDARDGSVLWEYELPAASEGVPAVYAVAGRQYVAIPVGGNGLFSQNLGLPEPGPGQYMVFALPR